MTNRDMIPAYTILAAFLAIAVAVQWVGHRPAEMPLSVTITKANGEDVECAATGESAEVVILACPKDGWTR